MKCYNHGELEAVGICVACGKALCVDCAISFDEIIHCKRCLEAGRFSEETRWQAKLMATEASPRGTPKDVFFKLGAAGSALGIIVPIFSIFSYTSMMLTAVVFALMGVVLAIQGIGYLGFYRNYGKLIGLVAYVMMLVAALGNITYAVTLLLDLTTFNPTALLTFSALQTAAIMFGGVVFLLVRDLTGLDELATALGIVLIITGAISFVFTFLFTVAVANVFATVAFFKSQLPVIREVGETDIEAKEILRNLGMS
jgi:hypothetical protein